MNRREALGVLGAAACVGLPAQESRRPDFSLHIGPVTVEPVKGKMLKTIGYNGTAPGPILRATEGKPVTRRRCLQRFRCAGTGALAWAAHPECGRWCDGRRHPDDRPAHLEALHLHGIAGGNALVSHTHTTAGRNLKRAAYTGQFGFFYIDPRSEPGAYDREFFLSLKEWDPYLTTMGGEDGGIDVGYKYSSVNGHALGYGEPIRVKERERVMLRILNASATLHHRLAFAGHVFHVTAMDGNLLAAPKEVAVIELGPAERIDAIVEMTNPGIWILGAADDRERQSGLGIVFEYAGQTGPPRWLPASSDKWSYAAFGSVRRGRTSHTPKRKSC